VVRLVWENPGSIPDSWSKQTLEFHGDAGFGFFQPKNGPCGVLAVIQATLITRRCKATGKCNVDPFSEEELAYAIAECLWKCRNPEVIMASFDGSSIGRQPLGTLEEVENYCLENLSSFSSENGLLLFVYSAVLSRTLEQVGQEAMTPLISGPFALAGTDLLILLMRGVADGNVGAYDQTGKKKELPQFDFGMLSWDEISSKIPLADGLKFPKYPVYIMHGGDHFTTAFQCGDTWIHWNGLPPAGPRLAKFRIDAKNGECKLAPPRHKESFFKPIPNEIEDIVQALKEDKDARPNEYQTWRYECVLAIDDPTVSGATRPDDYVPQTFEYGSPPEEAWRCASCYRSRFRTMCFGQNKAGSSICEHCKKKQEIAGWTIWLPFHELPDGWKHKMVVRNAPKITPVLWTKFPGAEITFEGDPPSI